MARTERKQKIGSKTMRVKKQCATKSKSSSPQKNEAFVGKPTPLYYTPADLELIIKKYETLYPLARPRKRKNRKKSIVNGFTAFRLYYSRFAKTYTDQENLSKELAIYWNNNHEIQDIWRSYSEEYKVSDTNLSFDEWFDEFKAAIKFEAQPEQEIRQTSTLSHVIVEDVYYPNAAFTNGSD